ARDCFVHHYGRKTFEGNKLDYNASLDTNRAYFADKWEGVIELWDNDTEKGYKLVLDPKDRIKIILKWGEDAFDQGDLKRSVQIFQRVLKLDAHNSQAINNLGVIQWQAGDAITAIETFQKVLVSFPENIDAFTNLVQAVKETGRCDLVSDAVLNQLRSHYPNSPELNMFAKEKVGS
ncbi:MAG: tetratricopeptide repeat protein, partial [Deltaproteobacteria bacterium]|nr:tetratricopeptide repeat protein [Deltaproteobacteria bacterium]